MEGRTASEASTIGVSAVAVKEEPMEQSSCNQEAQQSQQHSICMDEDAEQRNDCLPESQEQEGRASLNKCVLCDKTFTSDDEPKLLECLHAACLPCINNKISNSNTSVDVDVMRELTSQRNTNLFVSVFLLR